MHWQLRGGVIAILFNWIPNNIDSFTSNISKCIVYLFAVICLSIIRKTMNEKTNIKFDSYLSAFFAIICCLIFILFYKSEKICRLLEGKSYLSPYALFPPALLLFLYYVVHVIYSSASKKEYNPNEILYIEVLGAYIAISWSCGMSGGLAEGQATLGISFLIALLFSKLDFKFSYIPKVGLILYCLYLVILFGSKKYMNTYNWWGMDDSSLWEAKYESNDIELLSGIKLSQNELEAYETIYNVILENTSNDDTIYCFPQIPVFYSLCDKTDPGIRAKVQWFDVASDESILQDIETLTNNPPQAILIYETSDYAYDSHERLFRNGEISATRKMKEFLINYALDNEYHFYGRISSSGNNSFLLYYKNASDNTNKLGFEGEGSQNNPYLIQSVDDLLLLQKNVSKGNDYANKYFKMTNDIDCSSVNNWTPIGEFDSGFYFKGILDGNGYKISNIKCISENNVGLFGQLGGIVCNLGIVDSFFEGSCVGTISSHAVDNNATIINCYSYNNTVNGMRAGGIADNFVGNIINCINDSASTGSEIAGAVSYTNGSVINVYSSIDNINSNSLDYGNKAVIYLTSEKLNSNIVIEKMNEYVNKNKIYDQKVKLIKWSIDENGRLIVSNN